MLLGVSVKVLFVVAVHSCGSTTVGFAIQLQRWSGNYGNSYGGVAAGGPLVPDSRGKTPAIEGYSRTGLNGPFT